MGENDLKGMIMNYWWVNNRKTYKHQRPGGYLWAPLKDKSGNSPHHWESMSKVKKGDIVFSYVNGKIVSIATVLSSATQTKKPKEMRKGNDWEQIGRKVSLAYIDVDSPIRVSEIFKKLKSRLPDKYSPLTVYGKGCQGYLFKLPNTAGTYLESLVNTINNDFSEKIARICWNTNGWRSPTGRDGKSKNADSYEKEHGFGHEEWILDTSKTVKGWHYGFIQAIHKNLKKYEGRVFNIHLYTINSQTKTRYWVGQIKNACVVSEKESKDIYKLYKNKNWLDDMRQQLKQAQLSPSALKNTKPNIFFNIKYNVDDLELLDNSQPFSNLDAAVKSTYYTTLLNFKGLPKFNIAIKKGFKFRSGHNKGKRKAKRKVTAKSSGETDLFHNHMQNCIYKQLAKKYGAKNVGTEVPAGLGNKVDVVHKKGKKHIFYELKTANSVRLCIREALSQLMEYAYWTREKTVEKLIIVSQNKIDNDGIIYLSFLRKNLNIPVYYSRYNQETDILDTELF